MVEIERKFLVDKAKWNQFKSHFKFEVTELKQGYLSHSENLTTRVRTKLNVSTNTSKAYLTLKGKTIGISRTEFEYEIPLIEAEKMLEDFCTKYIQKQRFIIDFEGFTWEVDEFSKPTTLILAEIELKSENQSFTKPDFITEEVSDNPEYYNVNMLK